MANRAKSGVICLDTASPTPFTSNNVFIRRMKWVSPVATAGDRAVLQDAAGNSIWEGVAVGTQYDTGTFELNVRVQGILVPTLGSGTIYLYVG